MNKHIFWNGMKLCVRQRKNRISKINIKKYIIILYKKICAHFWPQVTFKKKSNYCQNLNVIYTSVAFTDERKWKIFFLFLTNSRGFTIWSKWILEFLKAHSSHTPPFSGNKTKFLKWYKFKKYIASLYLPLKWQLFFIGTRASFCNFILKKEKEIILLFNYKWGSDLVFFSISNFP